MNEPQQGFAGRRRRMKTPWSVRMSDILAEGMITVGGIATIVAVCLVALVLVVEVIPLFMSATVEPIHADATPWDDESTLHVQFDEYRTMAWVVTREGELETYILGRGVDKGSIAGEIAFKASRRIKSEFLFEGRQITAISTSPGRRGVLLGLDDGTVRIGKIGFDTTFIDPLEVQRNLQDAQVEADLEPEDPDRVAISSTSADAAATQSDLSTDTGYGLYEDGIIQRTTQGQFRLQRLVWEFGEPIKVSDSPVTHLDHVPEKGKGDSATQLGAADVVFAALSESGDLKLGVVKQKRSLFGGSSSEATVHDLPLVPIREELPEFLFVTGLGDSVLAIWDFGQAVRYDIRNTDQIQIAEKVDLLPELDSTVTACELILGRETLLVGDSQGRATGWFRIRIVDAKDPAYRQRETSDGYTLVQAHTLVQAFEPVTAIGISQQSRMFALGYQSGQARVFHMTTELEVVNVGIPGNAPVSRIAITPKEDGIIAESGGTLMAWDFDPMHPDVSLSALFMPVWYEGYAHPQHIWQSSAASVEPEVKFSLYPLISGTLKSTFYSLLFGAPIALLAAIYTSEFTSGRVRSYVKPTVEMMASLPSVVLGFLAALVFAPLVEHIVPAALSSLLLVPFTLLCGAFVWQLLPRKWTLRWQSLRLLLMFPTLAIGLWFSYLVGPIVEEILFAGDIKLWLDDPQRGTGVGGWLLLLVPLSAVAVMLWDASVLNPYLRGNFAGLGRTQFALLTLVKFLFMTLLTIGLAVLVGWMLELAGWDPRGTYIDRYEQRNAMVVGFVMGFAIIPIIYTIADDALMTVPRHLRSASLGCGATPWQTTLRIVIPTAMSGLFSALMIGLGRVVGETMIVLMAGGNTPVQDWNWFSGFRTLATNIAIELPEAVKGGSHFRVLFFSALVLFAMTFLINTVAEVIRLRFRRRAYQL